MKVGVLHGPWETDREMVAPGWVSNGREWSASRVAFSSPDLSIDVVDQT